MPAYDSINISANWQDRGVGRGADDVADKMGRMQDSADRVNRSYDGVARNGGRVNEMFNRMGPLATGAISAAAITQVVRMGIELGALSARADATSSTFEKLAKKAGTSAPVELQRMRDAVAGTLSDLELMQRVGAAVDAGLKFDQAITALEFLRRYSLAFGKDFNQLTQTIFTGLARGSVLFLDDAGIILSATDKMFDGLDDVEKKAALVAEAVRLMTVKMETLPEIIEDAATKADRLSVAFQDLQISAGGVASVITTPIVEGVTRAFQDLEFVFSLPGRVRDLVRELEAVGLSKIPLSIRRLNLPSDKGFALEAEAAPTRSLFDPKETVEIQTRLTPRINPAALDEVNRTLDMLSRVRTVKISADIPEFRGLATPAFDPQQAAQDFVRDNEERQDKDVFFKRRGDEFSDVSEAVDKSTLVTIAAIENLVNTLDFLPDEFQAVTSAATSFARAFATGNPFDLVSAGISAVSLVAGIFVGRAERARQIEQHNIEVRKKHIQAQEMLNDAIEDAIVLTGKFARSLASQTDAEVRAQFSSRAATLEQRLGPLSLSIENIIERESTIRKLIEDRFKGDQRFDYLYLALNEAVTIARTVEERKADAEIAVREEQAEVIIGAIERQRQAVLQKYADAEEAQRAAALRAVGTQFDFLEAELRARYSPQFQAAAGDDASTLVLRERAFADIERLRSHEGRAGEQALQGVSQQFAGARERTSALYDGMAQAVRDAIPDLSKPFVSAIAEQTQAFLARWDAGLVLSETPAFGLSPETLEKLSSGESLSTQDVANLLTYQLGTKSQLENAKILDLTDDQITKLTLGGSVVSEALTKLSEAQTIYGTGVTLTDGQLATLGNGVSVTLPEGWQSEIPVVVPEGLPDEILIIAPTDLASQLEVTVPEGTEIRIVEPPEGLPDEILVVVPEDLLGKITISAPDDLIDKITVVVPDDLPSEIPVVISQEVIDIITRAGTQTPPITDPQNLIDYAAAFEKFRAIENASNAALELESAAGEHMANMYEFPEQVATDIGQTKTDTGRVASASEAQRDYWTTTADLRLSSIATNTGDTKTNTDSLSELKTLLETIRDNTAKPSRYYQIDIDQDIDVASGDFEVGDIPEDELQALSELISGNVYELLRENTPLGRLLDGTGG